MASNAAAIIGLQMKNLIQYSFLIYAAMKKKKYSLENILTNLKIDALNEMQIASLEASKKNEDLILLSATGSGKTLAFLLPVLENIEEGNTDTQAMIVVPSRELAMQ